MRLTWGAASDPGIRRAVNEDSFCARPDLGLFVVADGMGGHAAGEVASRLAVETIESIVDQARHGRVEDPFETPVGTPRSIALLPDAFQMANRRLAAAVAQQPALRGMATTASALLIDGISTPVVAHIGDSRVYLLRDGTLSRITEDHSWVEEQVRAGVLDPRAARQHPWRSVVTRAINGSDDPRVDVAELPLQPGDRLLLCSDGLSAVIVDERIASVLREGSPEEVCQHLVALANDAGGPDNITIVVLEVHAS